MTTMASASCCSAGAEGREAAARPARTGHAWLEHWRAQAALALLQAAALTHGRWSNRRLWRAPSGKLVWLTAPEGSVAAELWVPAASGPVPGAVLVHGANGPLSLYSLLAARLAERGIAVLAIELPGFGRSPAPQPPWRPEQFTGQGAIRVGLAYLKQRSGIDRSRVSVIGHSFGGGAAAAAATGEGGVQTVVALGPARRIEERTWGPAAREAARWHIRFSHARRLPQAAPLDVVRAVSRATGLEYQLSRWQAAGHPPLLLLDGGLESAADRAFLAGLARQVSPPVAYRTVPGADHYLNSASWNGFVSYDREAVDTCVEWIAEWIRRSPPASA